MLHKFGAVFFFLLSLIAFNANADEVLAASFNPVETPAWVDIDDVYHFASKHMPDIHLLRAAVKNDARFLTGGVEFKFTLHFEEGPVVLSQGVTLYYAAAMMADPDGRLFFRKFAIEIGGAPERKIENIQILQDIDLSNMHFEINVGLIDRLVVVEDAQNDILLTFPLGVGGIDDHVMGHGKRILTPRFHGAHLDRRNVIPARKYPDYYRGKPFIPITNAAGHRTPIAFHITILSDKDWRTKGPNYLQRGFESHGCMRMRLKDLKQLFTIVEKSADTRLPVDVEYHIRHRAKFGKRFMITRFLRDIHPYPLEDDSYMRIKNFGTIKHPVTKRDGEHLLVMQRVAGAPDLSGLGHFSVDSATNMLVFSGLSIDLE